MQSRIVDVYLSLELRSKPQFFDFQIRPNNSQLFFDLDECAVGAKQIAKDIGQIQDEPPGLAVRSIDRTVQGVKRIE